LPALCLEQLKAFLGRMQADFALRQAVQAAATASTEAAAQLAAEHGVQESPEALWRQSGTLASGGLPTWRS
jgi:predicted ribosomally synthesized peptide with nif11-like leader